MNKIAFVPIRLNSKRVVSKSIRELGGRPLFCWLLEAMDKLNIPVHLYCSQNDVLRGLVDFSAKNVVYTHRPEWLDGDDIKGIDIYREFAKQVPADIYLLSHCTSPFVSTKSLAAVLDKVASGSSASCATVAKIQTFTWFDGKPLNFDIPRVQTQLLKPIYYETSAAYAYRADVLLAGDRTDRKADLVELQWPETEDIDYEDDFKRCQALVELARPHE